MSLPNDPKPDPRQPCPAANGGMNCQECVDFLLDYIDGRLPHDQRREFESHLAICPDCTTYMANYRKAASLTAGAGRATGQPPAQLPSGLVEAILRARKERR